MLNYIKLYANITSYTFYVFKRKETTMSDADSDADCNNCNYILYFKYIRYSLLYVDTTGYAFLRIKIHLRP